MKDEATVVYLARHGRTALNEANVLRGRLDPPLDEVGLHQATLLGAALASAGPVAVIASPLTRAVQTASPTADAVGVDVETDGHFVDRDYGPWAGHPRQEAEARWGSIDAAPGVEARSAVCERAMDGLNALARRYPGAAMVVVSHDAVNRELLAVMDAALGAPDQIEQDNGCFNTLVWRNHTWTVHSVNELPS